jgi:hypothetical protein
MIALMVTGVSMLNKDLMMWTGYSDKPISEGLALLEALGVVQFNGRGNGWSLGGGFKQMSLFDQSRALPAKAEEMLTDETQQSRTEADEAPALPVPLLTEDRQQPPPRPNTEIFRLGKSYPQETYRQTSMKSEIFRVETAEHGNIPTSEGENHRRSTNRRARVSSSSSNLLSFDPLSFDLLSLSEEEEEKENLKEKEKWLMRVGIGQCSCKMEEILSQGLSLDYIKAHVLDFEWQMKQRDRPKRLSVGTLIVKLCAGMKKARPG